MSSNVPTRVAVLVRAQRGLITDEQLVEAGVSEWTRRRWLREQLFVRAHPGVLRSTFADQTFEQQCTAATLAIDDLVISGPSSGRLHQLRRMPHDDVHAMVPRRGVRLEGVVMHHTNALGPSDIETIEGIRTLRPVRLAPDLARFLSDEALESVIEQMLDRRLVALPALFAMARRLRARGRDGMQRYLRVLHGRPAWQRPAGSEIELRFLEELRRRGLDVLRQYRVDLGGGHAAVLDAAVPEVRIAIEVDHVTWHGGRVDSQADKHRDRRMLQRGWSTVRVTDDDVRRRFASTADEVEAIVRRAVAA